MRRGVVAIAVAGLVVVLGAGVAQGDAKRKRNDYGWKSSGSAGTQVADVRLSSTDADGRTDDGDAPDATSTRSSAGWADVPVVEGEPNVSCAAAGRSNEGAASQSRSSAAQTVEVPEAGLTASLLSAECRAKATQHNNTQSSARTALLEVSLAGLDAGAVAVGVLVSESDAKTTSGQSNAAASSTAVEASAGDAGVTVLECGSRSHATNGSPHPAAEQSATALEVTLDGSEVVAGDLPVPCPAGTTSDADRID